MLYALAFILCFLSLDGISTPLVRIVDWIGSRSYGIYLLHPKVLELVARVTYHVAPWMLAHQALYQPTLVLSGAGIPTLFMIGVMKSRAKKLYSYLFG